MRRILKITLISAAVVLAIYPGIPIAYYYEAMLMRHAWFPNPFN
jgi:hypothetical protein